MNKKLKGKFAIRKYFLPISRPTLGKEEIKAVLDTLKGGWLTTGLKTFQFEDAFKKYIGAKHAIALNSCTSALHLALVSIGIGQGDEIILSPMTFVSQANVIVHLNTTPIFADIKEQTLNIDPEKIREKITPRTKAVIITHFGGQPCERDTILKLAKENNIMVIEDSAHALGAEWKGKKIGSDPETISCFSFYPIKNITTSEGGMLTTGRDDIAERVRTLSLHGLSKSAWERYSGNGSWEYDVVDAGYKYNLPDLLSSLGLTQLKKISKFNKTRENIASIYIKALNEIPEITLPKVINNIKHAWQIFPILLNTDKTKITRNKLIEKLKKLNVGTSVHFQPIHLFKFYREKFHYKEGDFPITEDISKRILSLPIFPAMSNEDCKYVIRSLQYIFDKN